MRATRSIGHLFLTVILIGCRTRPATPAAASAPTTVPATQPSHYFDSTPREFSLATPEVRVPFKMEHHQILVDGQINGVTGQFMVDTGSADSYISRSFALAAHLPDLRKIDAEGDDGIATSQRHLVLTFVRSLQVGGFGLKRFDAIEDANLPQPHFGILGRPSFNGVLLTVDYANSVLILKKGSLPDPDGRRVLALHEDEYRGPTFPVVVDGKTVEVEPDTGDFGFITLGGADGAGLNWHFPRFPVPIRGIYGTTTGWAGTLKGAVIIGDTVLQDPLLATVSHRRVNTMGYEILSAFTTTFDFANMRLELDPIEPQQTTVLTDLSFHCDDRTVVAIDSGGAADKAGMRVGDQIVSINGDPGYPPSQATWTGPQTILGPATVGTVKVAYGGSMILAKGETAQGQLGWIEEIPSANGRSYSMAVIRNWSPEETGPVLISIRRGDKTLWLRLAIPTPANSK